MSLCAYLLIFIKIVKLSFAFDLKFYKTIYQSANLFAHFMQGPKSESNSSDYSQIKNPLIPGVVYTEDSESSSENQGLDKRRLKSRISYHDIPTVRSSDAQMDNFQTIMTNNFIWSQQVLENDPDFFSGLKDLQAPQYLWIGCSDSRVPANQVVGLKPGELFVHRNIANQAPLSDVNALAVIQFAVEVLKVKDIIVCGHYGCGGVKAAFKKHDHGPLQAWLSYLRDLRARYRKQLISKNEVQNQTLLVQLNVKHNVENIARIPIVQKTWAQGKQLRIHGLVYRLEDGILNDLEISLDSLESLPEQYIIYQKKGKQEA